MLLRTLYELMPAATAVAAAASEPAVPPTDELTAGLMGAVGAAVGVAAVASRALDKFWPSKSDTKLGEMAEILKASLDSQRQSAVSLALMEQSIKETRNDVSRVEGALHTHAAQEDRAHEHIATHLARIKGGVNTP